MLVAKELHLQTTTSLTLKVRTVRSGSAYPSVLKHHFEVASGACIDAALYHNLRGQSILQSLLQAPEILAVASAAAGLDLHVSNLI
jgi:hypothetical protein